MPIDLEKLERLAKAATPGPWEMNYYGFILRVGKLIHNTKEDYAIKADTAYIVEACNAVPELIAENRALREDVDCLKQSLEWRDGVIDDLRRKLEQATKEAGK